MSWWKPFSRIRHYPRWCTKLCWMPMTRRFIF